MIRVDLGSLMCIPIRCKNTSIHILVWSTYKLLRPFVSLKIPDGNADKALSERYLKQKSPTFRHCSGEYKIRASDMNILQHHWGSVFASYPLLLKLFLPDMDQMIHTTSIPPCTMLVLACIYTNRQSLGPSPVVSVTSNTLPRSRAKQYMFIRICWHTNICQSVSMPYKRPNTIERRGSTLTTLTSDQVTPSRRRCFPAAI